MVVADRDEPAARVVADEVEAGGGRALALRVDVTDRALVADGIRATVERFGRLDVMFNNAGFNEPMRFLDITEENFRADHGGQRARGADRHAGGGPAVPVAGWRWEGREHRVHRRAHRVRGLRPVQRVEGRRHLADPGCGARAGPGRDHGERFCAGRGGTPLWTKLDADLERIGAGDTGFDSMAAGILLGRPAQPEDIVPTALFLAGSDSDYITGQIIPIEGGMVLV